MEPEHDVGRGATSNGIDVISALAGPELIVAMKILTLVRHAKSSWSDSDLEDHERPLNRRGQRDAPEMAGRINEAGIRPSLILCSTSVRTWTTAKIIAKEISYPPEFLQREAELYLAGLNTFLDVVGEQDEGFNSIMIVGHNPGLTDFANYLQPGLTHNVPTCAVISVSIDSKNWNLRDDFGVTLEHYDYPKKIR